MASSRFQIIPGAIDRILRGPQSRAQRKKSAERIARAWRANIHTVTGATESSIKVEDYPERTIVAADARRNSDSAWPYLEYGTSKMRAQAPGRRAIKG